MPDSSSTSSSTCTGRDSAGGGFSLRVLEDRPGLLVFEPEPGSGPFFKGESGGHRWQRIPPTEKRGRVQTSTVTVAVLDGSAPVLTEIREADLEWDFFCAGGPGGQNQNKVSSGARLRHLPSGFVTECREERDQPKNKARCREKLARALREGALERHQTAQNASRRSQMGSGERGDKTRTYRVQDDVVTDHATGRKTRLSLLSRGDWDALKG